MKRTQQNPPAWAPDPRHWPKGFTAHRDGWVRSHAGRTIWVAGKTVDPAELPAIFERKARLADERAKELTLATPVRDAPPMTYAQLLGAFLAFKEHQASVGDITPRTVYNYDQYLNAFGRFVGGHKMLADIGAADFTRYKRKLEREYSAMTIGPVVSYINAMFEWADGMGYIDRFRPGPEWKRPRRKRVRDQRIEIAKSFKPDEFAKLWRGAPNLLRLWMALGVCAAFINTDITHLTRDVVELDTGRIDFARRKTGKMRRVTVLPPFVAQMMRDYIRPPAADPKFDDLFFLRRNGRPYNWAPSGKATNFVTTYFNDHQDEMGTHVARRSFSGFRTTFYNLVPRGFELERKMVMGRAHGDVDLDHYLEVSGVDTIAECVAKVWASISSELADELRSPSPAAPADASAWLEPVGDRLRRAARSRPAESNSDDTGSPAATS